MWQAPKYFHKSNKQIEPITPSGVFGLYFSMASLNYIQIPSRLGGLNGTVVSFLDSFKCSL